MSTNSTATSASKTTKSGADVNESKFLTFCLGKEEYGVDILAVREIIGVIDVTPLPQTPDYVNGIINLRGRIIPVLDLRTRFRLPTVEHTAHTCIIVLEVGDGDTDERYQMGVIVDTVSEVLDIPDDAIEPAPDFGCSVHTDFVKGVGKVKDRVIILLDIEKVLAAREIASLSERVQGEAVAPDASDIETPAARDAA
jgi:purine-binding chemotaxis protein CheW